MHPISCFCLVVSHHQRLGFHILLSGNNFQVASVLSPNNVLSALHSSNMLADTRTEGRGLAKRTSKHCSGSTNCWCCWSIHPCMRSVCRDVFIHVYILASLSVNALRVRNISSLNDYSCGVLHMCLHLYTALCCNNTMDCSIHSTICLLRCYQYTCIHVSRGKESTLTAQQDMHFAIIAEQVWQCSKSIKGHQSY